jgi:hypothetical protein
MTGINQPVEFGPVPLEDEIDRDPKRSRDLLD